MTVTKSITNIRKQLVLFEALLAELKQWERDWPAAEILHINFDKPSILIDGLVSYIVYEGLRPKVDRRTSGTYPWRISIPGKTGNVELYDYLDEDAFYYYFHSMGLESEVKTNEET